MKKLIGALALTLMLAGCSTVAADQTPAPTPLIESTPTVAAVVKSAAAITSLAEALEYAASLNIASADLDAEVAATARAIDDHFSEVELPYNIHNQVGQALVRINADVLGKRTTIVESLTELQAVALTIKGAL